MRRLTILQTDSVVPELQPEFGDYPDMFARLLRAGALDIDVIDARQTLPTAGHSPAYLITGSKHSVYDPLPWIEALAEFLKVELRGGARVVGICFGHQLIAHFFGGHVGKYEGGWAVGGHDASVLQAQPWMEPRAAQFRILSSHQDQVLRAPDDAAVFARSEFCPISGFTLGDQVLTFQGHPEFEKGYSRQLMMRRRELLGDATVDDGIASLSAPLDDELVASWILRFLEGADG